MPSQDPSSGDNVPRALQVYVLDAHHADEGGPRTFSPKLVAEALASAGKGPFRSPLPRLIEKAKSDGTPIEMIADDPSYFSKGAPLADYCKVSSEPLRVFSRRAADVLNHLLAPNGTFIPLVCDQAELVGYLLERNIEALDAARAVASWLPIKGKKPILSRVSRYAFHAERLAPAIFTTDGHSLNELVLQNFVDAVRAHPFAGFRFCRVWPPGKEAFWNNCRDCWV